MAFKELKKDDYVKIVKHGHYAHGHFGTVDIIWLGIHQDFYEVVFNNWVDGKSVQVREKFKSHELLHAVKSYSDETKNLYQTVEDDYDIEDLSYDELVDLVYQQKSEIVRLKMELEGF